MDLQDITGVPIDHAMGGQICQIEEATPINRHSITRLSSMSGTHPHSNNGNSNKHNGTTRVNRVTANTNTRTNTIQDGMTNSTTRTGTTNTPTTSFSMQMINVCGLRGKLDIPEFRNTLEMYDINLISETKLDAADEDHIIEVITTMRLKAFFKHRTHELHLNQVNCV